MSCTLLAWAPRPAAAHHTVFDFTVDRFEADGNTLGPFDGVPDWVDEFDDPAMPGWTTPYGTSSVSGGRLHVMSPGVHIPGPDGTTLDVTEVVGERLLEVSAADFTATAVFDPIVPPEGHFYHFTLFTFGSVSYFSEVFGIDINTIGGETHVEQHLVILDIPDGIYDTIETHSEAITAADMTGQLHLRLAYNGDSIFSSYSLDGGATFRSPFPPSPIFTDGRDHGEFLLGADPRIAPTTTSTTSSTSTSIPTSTSTSSSSSTTSSTTSTTIVLFGGCERTDCATALRNRIDLRWRPQVQSFAWGFRRGAPLDRTALGDPAAAGGTRYVVCMRDGASSLRFRSELPAGGSCGGRPCWQRMDGGYRWVGSRDSGEMTWVVAMPGGSGGSRAAAIARGPSSLGEPPGVVLPLTVQLEAESGACWTSTFTASDVVTSAATHFRASTH